ncbi:MAG TPA: NAD(P)H-dependent glycerol-3-phosphate dehydrogenase [Polyangiaceae bacterium]|nr:NAD(P)H-dependent glycerol-3-phosphate dehydrogenase [Polyangiaceae bacterium]
MKRAAILGAGAWGTALATVLARKGEKVTLWTRRGDLAAEIARNRENRRYLPGTVLADAIYVTSDLARALSGADVVLLAIPSHAMRAFVAEASTLLPHDAALVSATKGIENDSLMLMREVILDVMGPAIDGRLTVLSGPSFAREVALELPTALVVAGVSPKNAAEVQSRCATDRLRVYTSDDPTGVELGGALKNVIAIAAGACDGLGYGHNSRAALITRGLAEMVRLSMAKGGNALTLAGLSGLGDLVLTCTGELSRNRTVGIEMGRGRALPDVLAGLGHVAEGVKTAKSAYDLGRKYNVEMPITTEVYRVLYEGKSPKQAVSDLMARALRPEF